MPEKTETFVDRQGTMYAFGEKEILETVSQSDRQFIFLQKGVKLFSIIKPKKGRKK